MTVLKGTVNISQKIKLPKRSNTNHQQPNNNLKRIDMTTQVASNKKARA